MYVCMYVCMYTYMSIRCAESMDREEDREREFGVASMILFSAQRPHKACLNSTYIHACIHPCI